MWQNGGTKCRRALSMCDDQRAPVAICVRQCLLPEEVCVTWIRCTILPYLSVQFCRVDISFFCYTCCLMAMGISSTFTGLWQGGRFAGSNLHTYSTSPDEANLKFHMPCQWFRFFCTHRPTYTPLYRRVSAGPGCQSRVQETANTKKIAKTHTRSLRSVTYLPLDSRLSSMVRVWKQELKCLEDILQFLRWGGVEGAQKTFLLDPHCPPPPPQPTRTSFFVLLKLNIHFAAVMYPVDY